MLIQWFGHSSFLISDTLRIITDPYVSGSYDGAVAYRPINENADIVIASHDHPDHYGINEVSGEPVIIEKEGHHEVRGIKIDLFRSFHDEDNGKQRGINHISRIAYPNGLNIVHFGDQGCMPPAEIINELNNIDIVFIPVGGFYTIDAKSAKNILDQIKPKIVIPMHYKTTSLGFPIEQVNAFTSLYTNVMESGDRFEFHPGDIKGYEQTVVILKNIR